MTPRHLMNAVRRRNRSVQPAAATVGGGGGGAQLSGRPFAPDIAFAAEMAVTATSGAAQHHAGGVAAGRAGGGSTSYPHAVTEPPFVSRRAPRQFETARLMFDAFVLVCANVLVLVTGTDRRAPIALLLVFDFGALILMAAWKAYTPRLRLDALDSVRVCVASTAVAAMAAISLDALVATSEPISYDWLRLWGAASAPLALGRIISTRVVTHRRKLGLVTSPTLIVGAGLVGRLTARRFLSHPEWGLHPIGFIDKDPVNMNGQPLPVPLLGASWDIEDVVNSYGVECVIVTFSSAPHDVLLWILDECARLGIRSLVVPRLFERVPSKLEVTHAGGLPLIETYPTSLHNVQYVIKYAIDRVVAAALIVLLSPLLVATAIVVAVSLGRPILYRQSRVGRDGRTFDVLKFRTMHLSTEPLEDTLEFDPDRGPGGVEGSDRRSRVGKVLRKFSIDELAQLLNVLKGEMSIVGPRPERPEFVEYFGEHVRRYDARHRVKSGITGWAQIHRLRGKTSITDRVEWDNYYIENFSLWLDIKILLLTIPEVFRGSATE